MGVFNQLIGDFESGLEGGKGSLARLVLSAFESEEKSGQAGSLINLISRFQQAGLGDVVQSWINKSETGKEVTPDQVQQALGEGKVQELAQRAGLPKQALLVQFAAMLPRLVEALTRQGQGQPSQQPGDAELPGAQGEMRTANSAVSHTDPTEPVQSADGNAQRRTD